MSVFLVVFSNYSPAEIDSVHATRKSAEIRAEGLGGDWRVEEWEVQSLQPPAPAPEEAKRDGERCGYVYNNEYDQSRCGYRRDDHVLDGGRSVVCSHHFVPPASADEKERT